jgi:uncharacterized iron-regulated protein
MKALLNAAVAGCLFASACAQPSTLPRPAAASLAEPAASRLHAAPMRLVDTQTKREVSLEELATRLAKSDYVLIGELHDNPHHHRAQAQILELIARTRKPQVLFEMLVPSQQARAQAYLASGGVAAGFGTAVNWESGFAPFAEYQPILEIVVQYKLQVHAANLEAAQLRAIAKGGPAPMLPVLSAALQLDLQKEIGTAHCGMLPEQHLEPMAQAQRTRDLAMANAMLEAHASSAGNPAVLIAGRGHTRRDRGVPYVLATLTTESKRLSIALLEHAPSEATDAEQLAEFASQADIVGFAPSVEREDQCEAFRTSHKVGLSGALQPTHEFHCTPQPPVNALYANP